MAFDRIPDDFPVLRGHGLTLRAMSEEDLPAWFERRTDAEACRMAGDPVAESMDEVVAGLEFHRAAFREKTGLRWAIVPDALRFSVGSIGYATLDAENLKGELGAAIGRPQWGKGYATAATLLAVEYGFEALGLVRIQAVAQAANAQSVRVLEKTGFEREGLLRAYELVNGVPADFVMYGRVRT